MNLNVTEIIEFIDSDNFIFGLDYPHMDRQPDVVINIVGLDEHLAWKSFLYA